VGIARPCSGPLSILPDGRPAPFTAGAQNLRCCLIITAVPFYDKGKPIFFVFFFRFGIAGLFPRQRHKKTVKCFATVLDKAGHMGYKKDRGCFRTVRTSHAAARTLLSAFPRLGALCAETNRLGNAVLRQRHRIMRCCLKVKGDLDMDTFEKIRTLLAEQLDIDPETIEPDSDIMNDFEADSLDIVDMIMTLEDEFGIEVPDEAIENLHTVGDVVQFVDAHKG
jgi:acyl carrier protein